MGIKRFQFLSRHPDIEVAEFQRIWRDERGPGLMEEPSFRRNVLRYEQNHRLVADYERERDASEHASSFDGVEVFWFESPAAYEAFAACTSIVVEGKDGDPLHIRTMDW